LFSLMQRTDKPFARLLLFIFTLLQYPYKVTNWVLKKMDR
jgi:hypothetical protein